MGAEGLPAPRAEGSLEQRPFAHLLVYIHLQELTGTLVVWPEQTEDAPAGQDRILFQGGIALAGRLLSPASALDRGMLPLFTRVNAPYAFYEANLLGTKREGLVPGRVDPITLIAASLRGSAREDAIEGILARFEDAKLRLTPRIDLARFGFEPKEMGFVELIRAEPAPVAELVRAWGDERAARRLLYLLAITRCVEPFEGRRKAPSRELVERLTRSGARHPSKPGTRRASRAGADTASQPGTASTSSQETAQPSAAATPQDSPPEEDDWFDEIPAEGVSAPPASPPRTSASPGTSAAARASAAPGASAPPQGSKRPARPSRGGAAGKAPQQEAPPPPPADLSPEHAALWQELLERTAELDNMNYFEMLGVSRSAGPSTVRDAYFALAKKWHPDRLPRELEPLRPWVDTIFHHATRARDTLSDDQKRGEYLKTVQEGGGTPEAERQLNAIITAAMAVQRVEVLVRRREWLEALQTLNEALELNPEDSDAHAMLGWVLFQRNPGGDAPFDRIHAALDRALGLNPRNAKAHHHKAMVLKRQGREQEALAHFRKCAEIDPKNIDAAREVRLANMRGGRSSVAPGKPGKGKSKDSGGVLSKLFGKK